jgi:hypothetical protein
MRCLSRFRCLRSLSSMLVFNACLQCPHSRPRLSRLHHGASLHHFRPINSLSNPRSFACINSPLLRCGRSFSTHQALAFCSVILARSTGYDCVKKLVCRSSPCLNYVCPISGLAPYYKHRQVTKVERPFHPEQHVIPGCYRLRLFHVQHPH